MELDYWLRFFSFRFCLSVRPLWPVLQPGTPSVFKVWSRAMFLPASFDAASLRALFGKREDN